MSIIIKPKHNVPTLYPKSQYAWETNASKTTYDRSSEIKCSFQFLIDPRKYDSNINQTSLDNHGTVRPVQRSTHNWELNPMIK